MLKPLNWEVHLNNEFFRKCQDSDAAGDLVNELIESNTAPGSASFADEYIGKVQNIKVYISGEDSTSHTFCDEVVNLYI